METGWKWFDHMARCTRSGIVSQLESVVADLPTSASARFPEVRAATGGEPAMKARYGLLARSSTKGFCTRVAHRHV